MKIKYLVSLFLMLLFLMSVAGVSASEDVNQKAGSEILSAGISDDAISLSSDVNIISSDIREWYVNASAAGGGDGSNITPYNNFKSVLDNTDLQDGDNVYFAGGEIYTGDRINVNLNITKQLNLLKYGSGEAVFDAGHNSRIFTVQVSCINITGLTFVNGSADNGGALYFSNAISNSNINATYINNAAEGIGGANYFGSGVSNSNIAGTYTNNKANGRNYYHGGGANYFGISVSDSNVGGTYTNNTAYYGGANQFRGAVTNSNISGTYAKNTANRGFGGVNCFVNGVSDSNVDGTYINNVAKYYGGANYFVGDVFDSNVTGNYANNKVGGSGGANFFNDGVSGSYIGGNYTNNKVGVFGGANCFNNVSTSNVMGTYINNNATSGGANYFYNGVSGLYIGGTYINNNATETAGANYFKSHVSDSNFTGIYINNTALNAVIHFNEFSNHDLGVDIKNAIFLNNKCEYEIYAYTSGVVVEDSWFGNNASNFMNKPNNNNVQMNNWLFLNATANYTSLLIMNSSNITFKLFSTDGRDVFIFDNFKLPVVNLTLTATNGDVDKTTTLDKVVKYVATEQGKGSVTASVGDVEYTIFFDNIPFNPKFSAKVNPQEICYGENTAIFLYYNDTATGTVNITLTGKKTSLKIKNYVLNKTIWLPNSIFPDKYEVTVLYSGDGVFANASATSALTVNRLKSDIKVVGHDIHVNDTKGLIFTVTLPKDITGKLIISNGITLDVATEGRKENNSLIIDVFNNAYPVGQYNWTFVYMGNNIYESSKTKATSNILIVETSITANATSDLFVDDKDQITYDLTPSDAVGDIIFNSNDTSVVDVDLNGNIKAIAEGTALITVSFEGSENYTASSTNVTVTVSKIPTEINITNETIELKALQSICDLAVLNPAGAGNLTYTSSGEDIVRVSDGGIIYALTKGTATVTVSFAGDNKYKAAENKTIAVIVTLNDASISVENDTLDLLVDDTCIINATVNPHFLSVYFSSSNESVATVTDYGNVEAVGEGTAVITLTVGNGETYVINSTNVTVTVSKIPTEITVEPTSLDLFVGDETVVVANLTPADAGNVTFASSDDSIVTVDANGNVVAIGEGTANIAVSFAGDDKYVAAENKTISVTVKLKDASVSVENATLDLLVDENTTIIAVTTPEGLNVTYVPDESGVVSVENGVVTALKEGTASIMVKVGGDGVYTENTTTVTVTVSKVPTEISVDPASLDLVVGNESVIVANLTPADAGIVTFTSSDDSIVTVDDKGNVVAVGEGSAVITVSFAGDDKYATAENVTVSVSVAPKPKENATISIDAPSEATEGDNVTVTVTLPGDAAGSVTIGNEVVPVVNGTASAVLTNIPAGNTTVSITYSGDDKYNPIETNVSITVNEKPVPSKENLTIIATADPITVGENATIVVTGFEDATGNVTAKVSNGVYTTSIVDGTATFTIPGLIENVTANITYAGDDKYNNASTTVDIVVNPKGKENATISIDAPGEATEGDNVTVTVTLPEDATGSVTIGNEVVPVVNGTASAVLTNVPAGNTTVPITYSGDDKYNPIETEVTIDVDEKPVPPKEDLNASVIVDPITAGEDAVIVVGDLKDATGNVTAVVNGKTYTAQINDGKATITVLRLTENTTALISYPGDDKYNNFTESVDIVVNPKPKENATMNIDVPPVTEGQNTTVNVELPKDATGNVTAVVGGKTYTALVKDGKATITIPELAAGNYTVPVTYSGDNKYNSLTEEVKIIVDGDKSDIIEAPDVTKYFSGPERFVVTVTDYQGNPLANKSVTISINGRSYERTTDVNGTASIALGLNSGVYNAAVTVDNKTINSVVTILSTVNGTNIIKVFRNATQYYATFRDGEGNYLKDGETVIFNINGVMYERKVSGDKGLAKLNINLNPGEYVITAMNPVTGDMTSNNITVLSRITENIDLVKYYRNASQYAVKVIGDDGKAVGAGESVTFNINGVFYTRQTDANGTAKLNINLQPGDYVIIAEYKGCLVSNNIKVLPVLTASDISMKYRDGTQFKASLVDGQGNSYANQSVQFNIDGVLYNRITGSDGMAKLNIKLMPGEYIITSSYNGSSIGNKITIKG